ncbi:MAG: hypothetical protein JG782_1281 [Anaerophaga sp.]|nr:hypothetical protein [Anaerophaga sp.]MDK2841843.1 hypothetical protein [Anaerophaga sp.]MDN5291239.1 hypothetical protein [Anaerophaga sp.]
MSFRRMLIPIKSKTGKNPEHVDPCYFLWRWVKKSGACWPLSVVNNSSGFG